MTIVGFNGSTVSGSGGSKCGAGTIILAPIFVGAAGSTCSGRAGISAVIRPLLAVWGFDNTICGHGSIGSVWRGVAPLLHGSPERVRAANSTCSA